MRLGDGRRVSVNGATFDFGALMATLRERVSDPDVPTILWPEEPPPDGATHFDVAARRWVQYVSEGKQWIYVRVWKLDGSGWTRHPVEVSTEERDHLVPIERHPALRTFEIYYLNDSTVATGRTPEEAMSDYKRRHNSDVRNNLAPGGLITGKFTARIREVFPGGGNTDWWTITA